MAAAVEKGRQPCVEEEGEGEGGRNSRSSRRAAAVIKRLCLALDKARETHNKAIQLQTIHGVDTRRN